MSVSAEDLLAKAQAVIDKRAKLGLSVTSAAKEKANTTMPTARRWPTTTTMRQPSPILSTAAMRS
jgi:hypothetical protein